MSQYDAVIREFAEELTLAAKRELGAQKIGKNGRYGVATGGLQKSLRYSIGGGSVKFGSPLPHAAFIHWGVNGTQRNRSAPYSYRFANPSKKHVQAIREWMQDKPVRLRDSGGRFVRKTEQALGSAAYAIARSVKRNGLAGVKYWSLAYEAIWPKYSKKIAEAKAADFITDISAQIGGITIKPK